METASCEQLVLRVAEKKVNNVYDLIEFIASASRLAGVGKRGQLVRWRELVRPFGQSCGQALIRRAKAGLDALQQAQGQQLADAVIAAQDFACFLAIEGELLPPDVRDQLGAWIEETEYTPLDEQAVSGLELFLDEYPLLEEYRLAAIDAPMSTFDQEMLIAGASPRPIIHGQWPAQHSVELQRLDDPEPPVELMASFECLEQEFPVGSLGTMLISRRLHPGWKVLFDVASDDGSVPEVALLRLGLLPGRPTTTRGLWVVDLHMLDRQKQEEVLRQPLVINFRNGPRLRIA